MGAQVPAQGVTAAAGVAAHRAFERLLPGVQFDVAKQVSLLGEGGPTLTAVERPLTWNKKREKESENTEFAQKPHLQAEPLPLYQLTGVICPRYLANFESIF